MKRTERDLCLSVNTTWIYALKTRINAVFIFLNEIFKNLCQSDENSAKKKNLSLIILRMMRSNNENTT